MLKLKDETLLRATPMSTARGGPAKSGARFAVNNPANGEVLADVADLDAETRARHRSAHARAFPLGAKKTAKERARILRKWFDLMMANQEDLAQLMTAEQGKPLAETRGEVAYGASFIEWFAEEGKRIYGDVIPTNQAGRRIIVLKEPIGVVAAITPWNFPNAMITRKCAPALGRRLHLRHQAGRGDAAVGAGAGRACAARGHSRRRVQRRDRRTSAAKVGGELTQNPLVRKFSFTGSTEVGKLLMRNARRR